MYGRRRSSWLSPVLLVLAVIYGLAVNLRLVLYRLRVNRQRTLPCRVISVGNITLGGTGKTPAVVQIARILQGQGRRPAVLSRGYGRKKEKDILVVSDGAGPVVDAVQGGDEPLLIASKLPGVPVIVGADRYRAGLLALEKFHPDVMVLDDGYQHVRLSRDLNIALVDADDPFGNGRLFPAGILREPPGSLCRADIVLITRSDLARDLELLKTTVRRYTSAPIFTSRQVPLDLVDIVTGAKKPLEALREARVLAFSGIARPGSFFSLLRELGARLEAELSYPDHYPYTRSDLDAMTRKAADGRVQMIVTTEKDTVRLVSLGRQGVWSLRIEQRVVEAEAWERMLLGRVQRAES